DGVERPLDEHVEPPPPGEVRAIGDRVGLLDVVWRPLPTPPDDPGFARRLARRRAVALALLAEGESGDLVAALSELCPGGARVIAREPDAAMLGASTTPGAGSAPFVLDLGGGTVDLHRAEGAVSTAGGGELVLLVGGCACDGEVLDVVAGALEEHDVAVARGNVLGRHGPRAAVAVGLVLTFAQ